MSSPFDVQPPAWLVNVAKPVNGEEMGRSFAMGLSSLVTAFEDDPDAKPNASWLDSRKGLKTGMAEVSSAQIDPQWRVKGQLLANQVLEQRAQLAAQGALAEERRKETSAWMEDAPKLAPWITATPEERKGMPAPAAKSKIGMQTLQKQSLADQRYYTSKDQMANKLDQERLKTEHAMGITAKVSDWNDALGAAPPDVLSAIQGINDKQNGIVAGRYSNGLPTPEAIRILDQWRTSPAVGMTHFGAKASEYLEKPGAGDKREREVRLQDLRADEADLRRRIDAKAKNGEPTDDLEAELEDKKAQRKALAGGTDAAEPGAKPKDTFQRDTDKLLHEINQFTAQGKDKEAKGKKEELNVLNKTYVMDRNGVVLGRKMKDADKIKAISSLPIGAPYYDESTGSLKKMTQDVKDIVSKVSPPETKSASETPRTGSSAWMATSPGDRKSYLESRIPEVQAEMDKAEREMVTGKGGAVYQHGQLEKELAALKSELKKLSSKADSGFKFLSIPANL